MKARDKVKYGCPHHIKTLQTYTEVDQNIQEYCYLRFFVSSFRGTLVFLDSESHLHFLLQWIIPKILAFLSSLSTRFLFSLYFPLLWLLKTLSQTAHNNFLPRSPFDSFLSFQSFQTQIPTLNFISHLPQPQILVNSPQSFLLFLFYTLLILAHK